MELHTESDSGLAIGSLTNHDHVAGVIKDGPQAGSGKIMVVGNNDLSRRRTTTERSGGRVHNYSSSGP
jgi:hypothetical protein